MNIQKRGAPARYPFTSMNVGDVVQITFEKRRLQGYVHTYAAKSGKKFTTKTIGSVLFVTRTA